MFNFLKNGESIVKRNRADGQETLQRHRQRTASTVRDRRQLTRRKFFLFRQKENFTGNRLVGRAGRVIGSVGSAWSPDLYLHLYLEIMILPFFRN
jgi:hypothetical protein